MLEANGKRVIKETRKRMGFFPTEGGEGRENKRENPMRASRARGTFASLQDLWDGGGGVRDQLGYLEEEGRSFSSTRAWKQ